MAGRLAPWGNPPTPLLPRWYRETLSELQLPREIKKANPTLKTVGELGAFWEKVQSPVDKTCLHCLVDLVHGRRPPSDYVVIPAGIDHHEVTAFPLRPRTARVLKREGLLEKESNLTVGKLMSFRNFGLISLLDLMCVAELALSNRASKGVAPNEIDPDKKEQVCPTSEWGGIVGLLDVLFSAANEFYGASTLAEALEIDLSEIALQIGINPALDSYAIRDLTRSPRIGDSVVERLTALQASMEPREKLIFERRLFTTSPVKLKKLGQLLGVSPEWVRQIEQRLRKAVECTVGTKVGIVATLLGEQVMPVVDEVELDRLIGNVFTESEEKKSVDIAAQMVKSRLNYSCANGVCLNETALKVVGTMQEVADQILDDVGLIDEQSLRGQLPSEEWSNYFPQILQRCGFCQIGGRLALRNTVAARAKAALLEIGRPATTEEIAEFAGLTPQQVANKLARISTVARSDKTRWGLAEMIDDEYEGITAEIFQRINEDRGATALERLVEELPSRFGVSESSVHITVKTPQFVLKDGYVSIADESSLIMRDLHDVITGKTESGDPYWTFDVEDRYFKGHSLQQFPPELARELGCVPNGNIMVDVAHPKGCGQLSVNWRLSSPTGATLGHLTQPLERLGVNSGDPVRLVIKGSGIVELVPDCADKPLTERSETQGDYWLEQIKNRGGVI